MKAACLILNSVLVVLMIDAGSHPNDVYGQPKVLEDRDTNSAELRLLCSVSVRCLE